MNENAWRRELVMCAKYPEVFMSVDDRATFENLPLVVTIFRAARLDESVPTGFAWTFDRDWADMFSFFVNGDKADNRYVFQAECEPHKAVAYLIGEDGHGELVIFPENIKRWERILARRWECYEEDGRECLRACA